MLGRSIAIDGCLGRRRGGGFSLIELLVVIAIIVIVIAGMVTVGAHVRTKAQIQTTETTIGLLVSALTLYEDSEGGYPDVTYPGDLYPPGDVTIGTHGDFIWDDAEDLTATEQGDRIDALASIEGLYYWLDQVPDCREILANLPETATANDDGDAVFVDGRTKSLIEVNDAWGGPIWYEPGVSGSGNFPVLTSAGPDGVFGTADDIISSEF